MPLSSTLAYVKQVLDGQSVPGNAGNLVALVSPPNPELQNDRPHAYIWTSRGSERRNSGPRSKPPAGMTPYSAAAPAGWKLQSHSVSIWLTWFDDNMDPEQDVSFPLVIDAVMNILRTTQMPMTIENPASAQASQLVDLGKNMDYEYAPLRSTASQRYNRYDAQITAPVEEWIQA
jgi:hypothetical protein